MNRLRSFLVAGALAVMAVAVFNSTGSAASDASSVKASAQAVQVVENGPYADVQFRVAVTNGASSVASNVYVTFEDGLQVGLGDIAAGATAVSPVEHETIDVASQPTHHYPIPVKVQFTYGGAGVELAQALVINRPNAPAPVQ